MQMAPSFRRMSTTAQSQWNTAQTGAMPAWTSCSDAVLSSRCALHQRTCASTAIEPITPFADCACGTSDELPGAR